MSARPLPLAVVLLAGCGPALTGSGRAVTQDRPLAGCRGVRTGSHVALTVTRGSVPALSVTWDDNLLDAVTTEVRDGLLEVSVRNGSYTTRTPLTVAVTLPELHSANASGQSTIVAEVGAVPHFTALASGQGRITLRGSADGQDYEASGQATIDAGELAGKTATVQASGQARVVVGASGKVSVVASGQAAVEHAATDTSVATTGQAAVRKR